jgi:hypothetical protein
MAKPKSPNSKKNTQLKPTVSTISPPSMPNNGSAAAAAAPALEANTSATKNTTTTQQTATRKIAGKPEAGVVKAEARANLVPVRLDEEIRQLAYSLSERRGFESGHETEDWLAAEHEVRQRYRQDSALESR